MAHKLLRCHMEHPLLVVDDNVDTCDLTARLLAALGYQADVAYDGRTALQMVDQCQYGLAILDYEMPGMNGADLQDRLAQKLFGRQAIVAQKPVEQILDCSFCACRQIGCIYCTTCLT